MYSYLIVDTAKGVVTTAVAPSELFTPAAVDRFVDGVEDVNGWEVRELEPAMQDIAANIITDDTVPF